MRVGASVASVGDVDGDGFPDVAVGDAGSVAAYVFLGSGAGLVPSPASVFVDPTGSLGDAIVAGAGDVNGDGFADLLDHASNRAEVYMGSATGLTSTASASLACATIAGAGDVNGDGFADVIASLGMLPDPLGHVGVYLGGVFGLDTTPDTTRTGVSPDTAFGVTLAGAGDVNGDRLADALIVSEIQGVAGRVSQFLGNTFSSSMNPDQTLVAPDGSAGFGASLALGRAPRIDRFATRAARMPHRRTARHRS